MNTILYCRDFPANVDFYERVLMLPRGHAADWFVEFRVAPGACVSVADEARTRVKGAAGGGITLTLEVDDAAAFRRRLVANGLEPPAVARRPWNAVGFFIHDPEGNRIEIWSPASAG